MITVIIPALNEEKTVARVVKLAKESPNVTEVIVVDDKSMDETVKEARNAGASVVTSTKLGKGTSMKDGVLVATNEIIVFLDADIVTYPENVVMILTNPLIGDEADFVKSFFTRQAGRVTELVAKPLLSILYPTFPNFKQPLSGMIAGRKTLFSKCEFEEGYGVDIGVLIDMYHLGARIKEISIGNIENKMQPLEQLGKMSREVARTIMKKSKGVELKNLETYENIQVIREQMEFAIHESLMSLKKIAVFDMDNTILRASFINTAATHFGFAKKLGEIVIGNQSPFIRTKLIAWQLKGRTIGELLSLADNIEVTQNLEEVLLTLKTQGYITGIISDSYDCIANHLKNKFGFDFTISNELEFSKSIATGEVKIPSLFLPGEKNLCNHDYCKLHALIRICLQYNVDLKNTLVIGNGINDICMIEKAGIGVSFCSSSAQVDSAADFVIKEPDFNLLIPILN
ncbi:MAG: HAD-IB family phosphatase [Chitinophagaceae bacterium]